MALKLIFPPAYASKSLLKRLYINKLSKPAKMKRTLILSLTVLSLAILTSGISAQNPEKETRDLKGFTKIGYAIPGTLKINIGPEFKVVLEGDKDDLKEVITEVSDGKLKIRLEHWGFNFNEKINAYVTMPRLAAVSVSGSGRAEILDSVKEADDFEINISGSGSLQAAEIVADAFDCSISGSGKISISSGSADRGEISISGSGSYSAPEFEIDHLEISVSGSGNCLCKAGDSLKASISGSGSVHYKGDPKIDARVSGSGKVRSAE